MVGQHMETLRHVELLPGYVDFGGLKKIVSPTAAGDYVITVVECTKDDPWKGTFKFLVTVR